MLQNCLPACGLVVFVASTASAQTVLFEDQVFNTTFNNGTMFTASGVDISVNDYFFDAVTSFSGGFTTVDNLQRAGGTGLDMNVNNVNLDFNFGTDVTQIFFNYGDYGGSTNLSINNNQLIVEDLVALDGNAVAGVTISAPGTTPVLGGQLGTVTLNGLITQFSVGGQEFYLDSVRYTPIPAPGAAGLCAFAGLAAIRRRRA
ncbi:MAG: hypothetical protein AAGB34_02205 [Planctomycetota bacterium]